MAAGQTVRWSDVAIDAANQAVAFRREMEDVFEVQDEIARKIADHIYFTDRGVIVEHGPTDAMFHSPQDPRTYDYVNGRFG